MPSVQCTRKQHRELLATITTPDKPIGQSQPRRSTQLGFATSTTEEAGNYVAIFCTADSCWLFSCSDSRRLHKSSRSFSLFFSLETNIIVIGDKHFTTNLSQLGSMELLNYKLDNEIAQSNLAIGRVATDASADPTHHPKPQLRQFMHFCTATPQTPHWLQWGTPYSPPKLLPPVDRSPNPTTCLIPGPIRSIILHRIHIQSAVLRQCTGQTDRQTNRCLEECFMTIGRFCSIRSDDTD